MIGSYSDHKKRTVPSFLFVPMFVAGLILNLFIPQMILFIVFSLLIFISLFYATETKIYIILIVLISVIGSAFVIEYSYNSTIPWAFELIFAYFVLGEKLFGVGDIKAIVAIIFGLASLGISVGASGITISSSIILFLNLGFVSIGALIFSLFYTYRITGSFAYEVVIENEKDVNPIKFKIRKRKNSNYISYKIPFLVVVTVAFLATMIGVLGNIII
jgi:hypothetical protein